MDYNKIEDAVLKKAMEFFKDNAVKFFGIDSKIVGVADTEIKNIEIKTNYTDYLFYTEDGNYLHFEFQTTNKREDIKRFLYYDASLFYKEKKKVRTVVVYSADIEDVETYIDAGTIEYEIEAFYMKNLDGDEKLEYIRNKVSEKEHLTAEDILTLSFIPLMSSRGSRSKLAMESIKLADNIAEYTERQQCITILYALFEKFGDEISKKKFKEVISMTEIGRMILDEGIAEGEALGLLKGKVEGKVEGKADMLIRLLIKKFNNISDEYKTNIKNLSEETIDIIALEIFDMEKIEEIDRYFGK